MLATGGLEAAALQSYTRRVLKRLQDAFVWLLIAGFILFPAWWWYDLLVGHFDMSGPMDDPSDAGPGERRMLRYLGLTLWSAAALTLSFFLVQKWLADVRQKRARRRGDVPLR